VLNATTACQEITSFLNTATLTLSQNFYQNFVVVSKIHFHFSHHQIRKHYVITVASWLLEYCHTGKFSFPLIGLILKYLNLKNYLANFVQNCEIYSKELLVNEINGITVQS